NAFSLNMLNTSVPTQVDITPLTLEGARALLADGFSSAVGHESTAQVLSEPLGLKVAMQRVTVSLDSTSTLRVAQMKGPRLPEGATTLPEGATIEWLLVEPRSWER